MEKSLSTKTTKAAELQAPGSATVSSVPTFIHVGSGTSPRVANPTYLKGQSRVRHKATHRRAPLPSPCQRFITWNTHNLGGRKLLTAAADIIIKENAKILVIPEDELLIDDVPNIPG
ncbi:Hypothetical protein FKW44_002737 [Caligus rogercresseyi]|uniref:Uncharacterized protein n=1 Tax=Caligus rogercresseyi TaxID=217165 RepID=A0A7T8KKM2_CALRO|nr:Hypothetical protein FKW44_002737 [Caligus rogercresseyi]